MSQAGVVIFDGQTVYSSYEQWLADVDKHCVPPDTPYSWHPGELVWTAAAGAVVSTVAL
jgi:hypothetical protein